MRERPILFSASMIRALLAGTKTQTRRIIKPQPPSIEAVHAKAGIAYSIFDDGRLRNKNGEPLWRVAGPVWAVRELLGGEAPEGVRWRCPYGARGDRLWVREGFTHITGNGIRTHYRADGEPTDREGRVLPTEPGLRRWMSPLFMPRKESRITLAITGVRVERLRDITEADACAEGVVSGRIPADDYGPQRIGYVLGQDDGRCTLYPTEQGAFEAGWSAINGPESWKSNPWVWVVEFARAPDLAAKVEARK